MLNAGAARAAESHCSRLDLQEAGFQGTIQKVVTHRCGAATFRVRQRALHPAHRCAARHCCPGSTPRRSWPWRCEHVALHEGMLTIK